MADAVRGNKTGPCQIGVLQGINLGGMTGPHGSAMGSHLRVGIFESLTQGSPATPSICVSQPGYWRFKWSLKAGVRSIQGLAMQTTSAAPYPSIVVKANPSIGINTDQSASSPGGSGWQTIGPLSVTATGFGVVWVELHNNDTGTYDPANGNTSPCNPAFFDHIVRT